MKFVKKFLILGLFALVGVSFCNAEVLGEFTRNNTSISAGKQYKLSTDGIACFYTTYAGLYYRNSSGDTVNQVLIDNTPKLYCFENDIYIYNSNSTPKGIYYYTGFADFLTCPTCPSCPSQYTSLECQTEYSLIPVSDVTENYCTANFDLISPADCPISSGTGDTQWSALFLNNVQYAGASNIYINVSESLDYSTTYIDSGSSFVFDVDGYVADTGYLNDILTVQEYHPNSEDFTVAFVGGLTLLLPYVVIVLFVVAVWTIIKKIFKS